MSDYTPSGKPEDNTRGISKQVRDEFVSIQDAINSKVDKNNVVLSRVYETITGFDSSDLNNEDVIFFLGRDTANDGGGGWFTFSSLSIATADGGIVFAPTGGGRLLRDGWVDGGFGGKINVLYFGAKRGGVINNTAAFQDAADASDNVVIVPDGDYLLSSDVSATGKHFHVYGDITGNGRLVDALVTRFSGNVLAIGRNADNSGSSWQGLQIGGGDETYGSEGVFLANDGNRSWLRIQPTSNKSPIELVIYTTSAQGTAESTIGTDEITRLTGSSFEASDVGRFIYFGESVYIIASVSGNDITVTDTSGGAVSFSSTATEIWQIAYVQGSGTCNVNGTTITRVIGDPFIAFVSSIYSFKINGTSRTLSTFTDIDTVDITANLGTLTGVSYSFEAQINHQLATLRVQKLAGSDEENLSIYARYDGYWIQSQYAGSGSYRKIVIGSGESTSGTLGRQIVCQKNGDLCLGNDYNDEAIRILNQTPANSVNRFETQAAPTGSTPAWRSRGADTNVNFGIDTQGTGAVRFTSASFTNRNFEIFAGSGASWLAVTSSGGTTPTLSAEGSGSNIDINLAPKGTGRVRLGNNNGTADAPISGYIEVKDYSGNIIKLATIA